jgi:LysR family hydrogen peroxide-inducible transcriptional activator
MMIQKLEEEMDAKIFDRSKHPVEPTPIGERIIEQARIALKQFKQIQELVENEQNIGGGDFQLGIIPTIASYLVPALLFKQHTDCSGDKMECGLKSKSGLGLRSKSASKEVRLILREVTTGRMIEEILNGTLDGGILAGPLNHSGLSEFPVYYEKFYAYVSPCGKAYKKKEIDLDKIDISDVWLLENEHCLRGQIERLCKLKKKSTGDVIVRFESGSIDTLLRVVDYNPGITIIPEMHAMGLSEEKQENLRVFKNQTAVREVSLVVGAGYMRKAMLNAVLEIIKKSVPKSMQDPKLKSYVVDL